MSFEACFVVFCVCVILFYFINNIVLNRSNMRAQYAANKLNKDSIDKLHKTFVNVYKSIQ